MRPRSLLARAVIAAGIAVPTASLAQEAAPAPAPAAEQAAELPAIEEIVVTAQKRAQSVQEVPVSVAALGGDEIDDFRIVDTNDLSGMVANLQVNQINGDGAPVFALRGITMNDYSVNQSSPIAVYSDEVYAGPAVLQPIGMFDLERVEVLRGPQGTLYGRNTTGGAVNLISRAPTFENGGELTGGVGNFERFEARGAAEYTLIDGVLGVRFAGTWADADGWFKNRLPNQPDANSTDEWAIRASVRWVPTDALDVVARFTSGRSHPTNYGIYADHISKIGVGEGADVYDLYNALGANNPPDYTRAGLGHFELESDRGTIERKRETDQASLHVNWDMTDSLTLTSVTSWTQGDFLNPEDTDGSPLQLFHIDYLGDGDQWAEDLRVTSTFSGPFDFVAGFYYANEQLDVATDLGLYLDVDFHLNGAIDPNDCADPLLASLDPPATLPAPSASPDGQAADLVLDGLGLGLRLRDFAALGCRFRNAFDQERRTIAGYFDGTLDVAENTTLLFGLRVTNDVTEVKGFRTVVIGAGVPLFDSIPLTNGKIDDTELTWKAGIQQRFSDDVQAYFTYSRGYRSGAFNAQAFFDPSEFTEVKPEKLDAVELGAKTTLADGRLQLNGALFYYIYKNQQLIDVTPAGTQVLVNIEESNVLGAEIEMLAQINERWRLSGGVGWLKGEGAKGIVSGVDIDGQTLPNSPDFNVNLASIFDLLVTEYGTLTWRIDGNYVGAQYFTMPHVNRVQVDNYAVFDTRFSFASADERWEAGFWIKNLGDSFYKTSQVALDALGGYDYTHIGPPRTYGADVTFHF